MRLHVRDLGSGLCKAAGFLMVLAAMSGVADAGASPPWCPRDRSRLSD